MPQGLMPSLFSLHDAKALCVILLPPSPCGSTLISESVVKRSWSQSDIRLQTSSCISSVFVVTHHVCAVHFIGSLGSPFCPLLIFHTGLLEPARCWDVYIMSPSLCPAKLTTMNFTEVYDWSRTASPGTESSSGRILAVRQTSRYTEPVHEWIGNIPVPKDKSIMWQWECSGKHLVLGRLEDWARAIINATSSERTLGMSRMLIISSLCLSKFPGLGSSVAIAKESPGDRALAAAPL